MKGMMSKRPPDPALVPPGPDLYMHMRKERRAIASPPMRQPSGELNYSSCHNRCQGTSEWPPNDPA